VEKLFTYIERFKFAIIGTVLFHVIIFLTTNFTTVDRPYNIQEEIVEADVIEIDEFEIDEEMLEMLKNQEKLTSEEIYNMVRDQNDQREKSYENFSSREIDEQVLNEAKELEQKYFDEWAKQHPEGANQSSERPKLEEKPKENTKNKPNNSVSSGSGENAFAGKVMVDYNLKDRKEHAIDIPGYTCNGSGTVVIDIKVDKNGNVKDASFNSNLSSNATECMIERAKTYAQRARFNYSSAASNSQNGTITYKFIGQ
jgi:hypothetical protein